MRIINKMKKTMLVLAASLFCANIAFADTQTVYSWESPEGTPAETGGTMVYTNGDGERLNYSNAGYHTICLNGKSGQIGDAEASANAGHMVLTLDEALKTGDVISITAYRNKNADGKAASIYFLFENGAVWKDTNTFVNICADDADEDYDDDGATPNTVTWTITDAEAGSKTLKLTRNSSGTNLFITKMTITREVEDAKSWVSIITNGDFEGEGAESFVAKENGGDAAGNFVAPAIAESIGKDGSHGIKVKSFAGAANDWDAQFWIAPSKALAAGVEYRVSFDYRATAAVTVGTQAHDAPGTYKHNDAIGSVAFTTEWQHFEKTGIITAEYASVAFNLSADKANDVEFFFDNVTFEVVDAPLAPKEWVNVITNGNFEGTSAYYFVAKENGGANAGAFLAPTITDAIGKDGSRGITMKSYAGAAQEWDAQFWIVAAKGLPAGTEFRVAFDYRASAAVQIATQAHGEPGAYQHWDAIGAPSFTTEWQHYEKSGVVSAEMAGTNGFKSIAFNLSKDKENDVEFFFDNITFEAVGVAPAFDMASLEKAVADANAWKATLKADDEIEAMAIEAVDEYVKSAQEWAAEAEAQEDVEMAAEDLAMTIEGLKGQLEVQKMMAKVEEARIAGEEALNAYPENLRSDRAGLVIALRNLPRFAMGMTAEMIQEAIDAVYTAIPLYKAENEPITAGTFYMKNVAAGKYLAGGNSWGTQASLSDHGLDVIVTRLENGKYSLDTNVPNKDKHYLGSNGFVDSNLAEWSLIKVTGGNYVITLDTINFIGYDGSTSVVNLALTDSTAAAAQWQFITKDELLREFANATVDSPVDATFFIQGQNFSRADNNRNAAWQGSPTLGKGNDNNWCAEKWNTTFDVYQDLKGLPNGSYKLSVQGFYRAGGLDVVASKQDSLCAVLYAGKAQTRLMSILADAGKTGVVGTNTVEGFGNVPNSMEEAGQTFAAGLYAGNSVTVLVTDGKLSALV